MMLLLYTAQRTSDILAMTKNRISEREGRLYIAMRQEKTGDLPSPLPEITRQTGFTKGTLGLWSSDHFVIYYREGRVPQPGIIILGRVSGDVSLFDRPGSVKVRVERAK